MRVTSKPFLNVTVIGSLSSLKPKVTDGDESSGGERGQRPEGLFLVTGRIDFLEKLATQIIFLSLTPF